MKLRVWPLLVVGAVAACSRPPKLGDPGLEVSAIAVNDGKASRGEWQRASAALSKRTLRVAVIATWCPHCGSLLRGLAKRPDVSETLDAFVIPERELDDLLKRATDEGQLEREDVPAARARFIEKNGIAIFDARVINTSLGRFFVARANGALSVVEGFPSYVNCNEHTCELMSDEESGPYELVRAKEEKLGE